MAVMNDDTELLTRSMPPASSEVRSVRRAIRAALEEAGADDQLADDAELVASELLTNAVEQRPDGAIEVVVRHHPPAVTLAVSHPSGDGHLPPVETWPSLPDAAGSRGRGLPIVAALTERVEVERDADVTSITCWWTVADGDPVDDPISAS